MEDGGVDTVGRGRELEEEETDACIYDENRKERSYSQIYPQGRSLIDMIECGNLAPSKEPSSICRRPIYFEFGK